MSEKPTVMVVDDTADGRLMLSMLLDDDYNVVEADSGQSCLDLIEQQVPDALLLDVNMPGMTGYEVCTLLRKQPHTRHLPIIFVSGLDSSEERLAGFEAGADEYVIKPVDQEDLLTKLQRNLESYQELVTAKTSANDAMGMAMEAMTFSSEMGQIVEFVKKIQVMKKQEEVAEEILNVCRGFGLNTAAMVNAIGSKYIGCDSKSLEAKVLMKFRHSDERLVSLGVRTIVINQYITLLIKNMPMDDEKRYGRLKDHLAVLMDLADNQLAVLIARHDLMRHRQEFFKQVVDLAEAQIHKTTDKLYAFQKDSQKATSDMVYRLEEMLFSLGLEEDQEKQLMKLANTTSDELERLQNDTNDLTEELGVVVEKLYQFFENEL